MYKKRHQKLTHFSFIYRQHSHQNLPQVFLTYNKANSHIIRPPNPVTHIHKTTIAEMKKRTKFHTFIMKFKLHLM